MKLFLLTILTITTLVSNAQVVLTPSKKSFEKKWIKNTNYQMKWYALKDTAKFEIGKVTTGHINFMGIKQKVFPF